MVKLNHNPFIHRQLKLSPKLIISSSFILMCMFWAFFTTPVFAADYSDTDNHWAKSYIDVLSDFEAISGYPDGAFKPNNTIKRIEFIAMIVNAQGFDVNLSAPNPYWGQPYIDIALAQGLIAEDEYGDISAQTFDMDISREEMTHIVMNAFMNTGGSIDPQKFEEARTKLTDFDAVSMNYRENAIAAVSLDFITGYPDGTFSPKKSATRAQASVLTYKLLLKTGFITEGTLPVNIVLSKRTVKQGDLLKITLYHTSNASQVTLYQDLYPNFKWYESGDVLLGYLPTNYSTTPGTYTLKFTDAASGETTTKEIQVNARDFRVQRFTVDTTVKESTQSDEGYAEYRKYFNPSREASSPVKYYTESFILPTKGKLTTEFGESRYVNGILTNYRHAGIDIAAPRSADVLATNSGKVVLSMSMILTGNSIVVDHGEGLFSVYFHLDQRFVTEGEMVTRGQLIGSVGSTGFSTGPHLHFTMSYYRFDIEPGYFLYGQALTKGNYLELMK